MKRKPLTVEQLRSFLITKTVKEVARDQEVSVQAIYIRCKRYNLEWPQKRKRTIIRRLTEENKRMKERFISFDNAYHNLIMTVKS